ncbi:hypothetical protein IW261DRAFT_1423031 [Armillaria novae-zelandiae]|uniref:Uncharacterized protein n=1 Tax=Armillaria novae-zelandiae TaxID=153914 RepID=A0AA39TZB7_9AGAR|nr:hypothetical protein IW261DRAFT_1423031 [Armillaria novae-zelandiae]
MTKMTLSYGETRTPTHPAPTTVVNQTEPPPKPYQRPPGKKQSDSTHKAEGKELAIDLQKKQDNKAMNLRRMMPGNPTEQEEGDQTRDRVEDTPRSKRPTKAMRQGDNFFCQEDMHQNVEECTPADEHDPFQADSSLSHHSRSSSRSSDWLHRSQDEANKVQDLSCQPSPSPVYVPAMQLELMMGKLQVSLQKDFNDKIAEFKRQKEKDRELFRERERSLHRRLEMATNELLEEQNHHDHTQGLSGPQEYEELLRLHAEKSRGRPEQPTNPAGGRDVDPGCSEEGQQDNGDEMDEDNNLIVPEGTTPLPSTPVDLATCPPIYCTKDIVFEGVDQTKVDCYLDQEATLFFREQNNVDTLNMTIAAAAHQLIDKKGQTLPPGPGQPPHTLILSDVPPRLERAIQRKHVFIYSPGMAFIALSAKDILTPRETFMGMLHAGNSSNAIHHNNPANTNLHREMVMTVLSNSQLVRDTVMHLFRCRQNKVDACIVENIDTLTLRPAQASVKTKNVPPTTGYALYMMPPRNTPEAVIAVWIDAIKSIHVDHPKMVLSYHIRHDFKCRICKDISHNDPDCPWPRTDGYLGPKSDTIFGKSDKARPPTKARGFQSRTRGRMRG